ncbi:PLP-dependent aminotransferase family protein [Apilactobacillus micheneri]|uniref:PLP-dependent aminotransferase family protein n=1 Tax=Apilactobacillus micheneri TaxID=1899430 RepID=A0A9Q8IN33_9LACO|nr:PLP-dependent aminotransferase family protein [Apilactobacillus micheneri]TPR39317.1 PLP-dependent aminotransferase family protein [Apilactobacillus micheneri]TPR43422.1 PLP-dependent aminotransferase family protein [Apilactobacillus micheneri]TPR44331.1 PLP-dependent aminotransferase family protein [Apilactobacillus micheneri]TPR44539.1 PLP-dependent aminotransferase family protein [Apilactobacillus micheneri]TPR47895.1 PLP-dependent aminotransferase family protein [Apilactobacillus michen
MDFKFSNRVPKHNNDVVGEILKVAGDPKIISFAGGLPAPELFPVNEMKKASDKVFEKHGQDALQYTASIGNSKLRQLVAKRMYSHKHINCKSSNICITTGSEQSIDLISKMMINQDDVVLVEKPTYLCALDVFRSYGAKIVGVDMDENGMKIDALEASLKKYPNAKLIYTIPNFQNPTGRTMPTNRRKNVADLARKYDVMVMEDDPYGEIRYSGKSIDPIKHFDKDGHVIYMSTFSKILAPGMRLGWIIADEKFVDMFVVMKQSADLHSDNLSQYIVAQYMEDNNLDLHIQRIRDAYHRRASMMLKEIDKQFPRGVKHSNPEGGMFIWVEVPGNINTMELFKNCVKHNVAFVPGEPFYPDEIIPGTFRLNFSNMKDDQIHEGIHRMADAITEMMKNNM